MKGAGDVRGQVRPVISKQVEGCIVGGASGRGEGRGSAGCQVGDLQGRGIHVDPRTARRQDRGLGRGPCLQRGVK